MRKPDPDGTFTIREALNITYAHPEFKSRILNRSRDKIRGFMIKKKHTLKAGGKYSVKYIVLSTSTPQYKPYIYKDRYGKTVQTGVTHHYQVTFETDKLSLDTKHWKVRLGNGRKWVSRPPQFEIQQIYKETRAIWTPQHLKDHKRKKYLALDVGDWNARRGVNADWLFRFSYVFFINGHRYGRSYGIDRNTPPDVANHGMEFALPKHLVNFFETMMSMGLLK